MSLILHLTCYGSNIETGVYVYQRIPRRQELGGRDLMLTIITSRPMKLSVLVKNRPSKDP